MNRIDKIKLKLDRWKDSPHKTSGCHSTSCPNCKKVIPSDFISKKDNGCVYCAVDGERMSFLLDFPNRITSRVIQAGINSCNSCHNLYDVDDLVECRNDYPWLEEIHYDYFCSDCASNITNIGDFKGIMWNNSADMEKFDECIGMQMYIEDGNICLMSKFVSGSKPLQWVGESFQVKHNEDNDYLVNNTRAFLCSHCQRAFPYKMKNKIGVLVPAAIKMGVREEYECDFCPECSEMVDSLNLSREIELEGIVKKRKIDAREKRRVVVANKKAEEVFFAGLALGGIK